MLGAEHHPGRGLLQDPDLAAAELSAIADAGLAGVEITSNINGVSPGAGGMPLMLPRAHYFWAGTWNEEPPAPERTEAPGRARCSPIEYARRYWYDTCVFDRRALRFLIDILGPDRLLIGTDFPAMPREDPCGKTLLSLDLPDQVVQGITWYNCFRFLGKDPPGEPQSRNPALAAPAL
jgi:hypothetical protein